MPIQLKSKKVVPLTALGGLLIYFCSYPGYSKSDWVEENVNEFQVPARAESEKRSRQKTSSKDDEISVPVRRALPLERHAHDAPYIPPPGTVVKDVSDTGGVELGPNGQPQRTRAPLEAHISTMGNASGYEAPGIDNRAQSLLMQAPMYAIPKTVAITPKSFRAWLGETHPGLPEKLTKDEIIEVKGQWDDSGHALRSFGLPFTRVTAQRFAEVNLDKTKVVIVNCAGELPNEAILSLRRYVAMGGSLLTTDWALSGVIQKAFPGYVEWNGGYTAARVVDAVEVSEDDAELLANTPPVAHWKLDNKSQTVKIIRPGPVKVLVRSRMLMREDPSNLGVLAFTLDYENGQILHLVGHFDNNSELAFNNALPDPAPGIEISLRQAIAANFLARTCVHTGEQGMDAANEQEQNKSAKQQNDAAAIDGGGKGSKRKRGSRRVESDEGAKSEVN